MTRRYHKAGAAFKLFLWIAVIVSLGIALLVYFKLCLDWWIAYLIGLNCATIGIYLYDKAAAGREMLRVPEKVLHGMALFGGSPAALVSQAAFRHKTIKQSFRRWFWGIIVLQIVIIGTCVYLTRNGR